MALYLESQLFSLSMTHPRAAEVRIFYTVLSQRYPKAGWFAVSFQGPPLLAPGLSPMQSWTPILQVLMCMLG